MKKVFLLFVIIALALGTQGCGKDQGEDTSILCYEAYAGIPDYGALFETEQYTRAEMGEVAIYSYVDESESDEAFQERCAAYIDAVEAKNETVEVTEWEETLGYTLDCGTYTVCLSRETGTYNGEELTLVLLLVGTPAQFEQIGG